MSDWFTTTPERLLSIVLSAVVIYTILVILVRMIGLRSFSKMSGFDFAVTVAVGSILASAAISDSTSVPESAVALATVFGLQFGVAWFRKHTRWAEHVVDNEPVVLMAGNQIFRETLARTRVTENDLWAKLREANVLDPREVRAVVLETTGDISVLHGAHDGTPLNPCLLRGIRDVERLELGPDTFSSPSHV